MARLYRPHIPVEVKCRVLLRQLGEIWPDKVIDEWRPANRNKARNLGLLFNRLMPKLADLLGCSMDELRLDHDPPLGARPKERRGLSPKTFYIPDANDPDHLFYRPHGPEYAGSHLIKTNVRGDHGQHPDRVLIKKQRRLERGPKPKRGPKIRSRGFEKPKTKQPWPKRKFK